MIDRDVLDIIYPAFFLSFGGALLVQTGELGQTDKHTDKQTNGRYQTPYLPCFAVDNNNAANAEKKC